MYCVHCGVQLADSEKACPLCGTVVYHPDLTRPEANPLYPPDRLPALPPHSLRLSGILTVIVFLIGLIVVLCDQQFTGTITWSGYVLGGLLVGYISCVLPTWFRKPNPVIFVPCAFAAATLYLLYINLASGGHWFMTFAFPISGGIGLIITAMVTLLRYVPKGRLYIIGGGCIALGGFALLIEFLLNLTFPGVHFSGWSIYPLSVLGLLGCWLIFLGICRPARELMARKFFI